MSPQVDVPGLQIATAIARFAVTLSMLLAAVVATAADPVRGEQKFRTYCSTCHAPNDPHTAQIVLAGAGNPALIKVSFNRIGVGPGFGGLLTDEDIDNIAAYLLLRAGGAALGAVPLVEYRHAGFGHWFMTANADEIAKLDGGVFPGWTRTGESFNVFTTAFAGRAAVCRFFTEAFAPKSSHVYALRGVGCEGTLANKDWQLEGEVFYAEPPTAAGDCPAGLTPAYRLYNAGRGGAPNHRFTTKAALRDAMIADGYVPEGAGAGVAMCVPR
jgi:cytochrome c553